MKSHEAKKKIDEMIGNNEAQAWILGEFGEYFALYPDGSIAIGMKDEIQNKLPRPIAIAPCIGIEYLDMWYYRDGWDSSHLSDIECIQEWFRSKDVIAEIETLREILLECSVLGRLNRLGDETLEEKYKSRFDEVN